MASIYPRGNKLWLRYKDEVGQWKCKKTAFAVGQESEAQRYADAAQRVIDSRRDTGTTGPLTLRQYVTRWCAERKQRGVGSVDNERRRLEAYALPTLGSLRLDEVRTKHIRDLVRMLNALKKDDGTRKLAPRSVLHVFSTLHTLFRDARADELISGENPVQAKRGELPKKLDADPEWRSQATYTVREVERLFSDAAIPVERRVQYAIKAIAGLRHGEMAALCWRHLDYTAEPLARINVVQSWDSVKGELKSTKTGETRAIPLHPTLAKILAAWKLEHWARIYGRSPSADDFIVPTRNMTCVNVATGGRGAGR